MEHQLEGVHHVPGEKCNALASARGQLPFCSAQESDLHQSWPAINDATFDPDKQLPAIWNEVYNAEQTAFSGDAIRAAFRDTCLLPWTREGIMGLIQRNVGKFETEAWAERDVETVQRVAQFLRGKSERTEERAKGVAPVEAIVEKNVSYTAFELEQKTAEEQQRAQQQQEQRRRKRALGEAEAEAKRKKFTCMVDGCETRHKGGKKWAVCERCERRCCPSHVTFL